MVTFTPNLLLGKPQNFGDVDQWGPPLNTNCTTLDQKLAQTTTINYSGVSSVTMTQQQGQFLRVTLTGTPTANPGTLQLPVQSPVLSGFWVVQNTTTVPIVVMSGAGTTVTIAVGSQQFVVSDGVNVSEISNGNVAGISVTSSATYTIPSNTRIIDINLSAATAMAVNMPASPTPFEEHVISDAGGTAAPATPITLSGNGNNFGPANNLQTTYIYNFAGQSMAFYWNGTFWVPSGG